MLKLCSGKSERTRSKSSALNTGCNQLKDTNSLVVSSFPLSARLSYHSGADLAPAKGITYSVAAYHAEKQQCAKAKLKHNLFWKSSSA